MKESLADKINRIAIPTALPDMTRATIEAAWVGYQEGNIPKVMWERMNARWRVSSNNPTKRS